MDPLRIESYLRSTCSVLDFDIGEVWCATKLPSKFFFPREPVIFFVFSKINGFFRFVHRPKSFTEIYPIIYKSHL